MALKSIVEDLSEVPEDLHEDYEENEDGKYVLRKTAFEDHPAWKKLKGTLNSLDREKREFSKKAQKLDELAQVLPEDLNLSEIDEETREAAYKLMRGEISLQGSGTPDPDQIEKAKQYARKPLERDLEKVRAEAEQYRGLFTQTVRDNALTEAMSAVKIADPYRPAVKAMFKDRAKVEVDENGNASVMIDGEYGPMDANSFFREWAQTEQGQHFVTAPNNVGGGAKGGAGSGKQPNPFVKTIDGRPNPHYSLTKAGKLQREQPDIARKMAKEAGWKDSQISW